MYVDVFVAGVGKWYEFKCEEKEMIKDIITQIYFAVIKMERLYCNVPRLETAELLTKEEGLHLACIDSKQILNLNMCLEECMVKNGNKLMLF